MGSFAANPRILPRTETRPSPDLRLHSVHVYVRDQERSLRFYLDQLGFELVFDARLNSGERWLGVAPPNGTAVLTLIQPKPESPESKLIGRATRAVFVTEDVPAKFRDWSHRGVRFRHTPRLRRVKYELNSADDSSQTPAAAIWGEVFTRFEDIDRNSFALVSFDAVTAAIEAQRRAHAAQREAERRLAYELEIARQVQARLFPQRAPECSSLEYFFAEYDGNLRRLRYVNCGHLAGLLVHADGSVERLGSTNTVLGLFGEWSCSTDECRVRAGDILALYTDGVTESFNDAGEEFGEAGLLASVERYAQLRPGEMVEAVLSDVRHFGVREQHDDVTLTIAKCREAQ